MLTAYIIEFLFFGFVGWLLDSIYRLVLDGQFLFGGYLRWIPIRPIYGLGGLSLSLYFKTTGDVDPLLAIFIGSIMMVFLEYISGIFSEYLLRIKLWDYSESKFNLGGKVDILHSIFWFFLVFIFYTYIFKFVLLFESTFVFPHYLDLPVFWAFVVIILFSTIKNHPAVVFGNSQPLMCLFVYDHHKFAILLRKFKKAKKPSQKALLKKQLQPYMKLTGMSLKDI
ncbi:putative ABC transporter permease [Candidatus Gracilibacteria bacterium]|jgi:uncharacterized membrane protein|nr:putative ABC transporter permease [Candidatus Gracilibacteria bacterium]